MATLVHTHAPQDISIKYLDDVTSVGVNRRTEGLGKLGIYRGFYLQPGSVDMSVTLELDVGRADHVALLPLLLEEVAVHSANAFGDIDLTAYASSTAHLVLQVAKTPSTTVVTLSVLTDAELAALTARTYLVVGSVDVPASGAIDQTMLRYSLVEWGGGIDGEHVPVLELIEEPITNCLPFGYSFDVPGSQPGSSLFPAAIGSQRWSLTGDGGADGGGLLTGIVNHIYQGEVNGPLFYYRLPWNSGLYSTAGVKVLIEVSAEWSGTVAATLEVTLYGERNAASVQRTFAFNPGDPATTVECLIDANDVAAHGNIGGISVRWVADSSIPTNPSEDATLWAVRARAVAPLNAGLKLEKIHGSASGSALDAPVWIGTDRGYAALVGNGNEAHQGTGALHDYAAVAAARYFLPTISDKQTGPSMVVAGGSKAPEPAGRYLAGGANLVNDGAGRLMLTDGIGIKEDATPQTFLASSGAPWRPSSLHVDGSKRMHPVRMRRKTTGASALETWGVGSMNEVGVGVASYDFVVSPAAADEHDTGNFIGTDLGPILNKELDGLPTDNIRILLMPGSYTVTEAFDGLLGGFGINYQIEAIPDSGTTLTLNLASAGATGFILNGSRFDFSNVDVVIPQGAAVVAGGELRMKRGSLTVTSGSAVLGDAVLDGTDLNVVSGYAVGATGVVRMRDGTLTMTDETDYVVADGGYLRLEHCTVNAERPYEAGGRVAAMHTDFVSIDTSSGPRIDVWDLGFYAEHCTFDGRMYCFASTTTVRNDPDRSKFLHCRVTARVGTTVPALWSQFNAGHLGDGAYFKKCHITTLGTGGVVYMQSVMEFEDCSAHIPVNVASDEKGVELDRGTINGLEVIDERTSLDAGNASVDISGESKVRGIELWTPPLTGSNTATYLMRVFGLEHGYYVDDTVIHCRTRAQAFDGVVFSGSVLYGSRCGMVRISMEYAASDAGAVCRYFDIFGTGRYDGIAVEHDSGESTTTTFPDPASLPNESNKGTSSAQNVGTIRINNAPRCVDNTDALNFQSNLLRITQGQYEHIRIVNSGYTSSNPDQMLGKIMHVTGDCELGDVYLYRQRCRAWAAVDLTNSDFLGYDAWGATGSVQMTGGRFHLEEVRSYWSDTGVEGGACLASQGRIESVRALRCGRVRVKDADDVYIEIDDGIDGEDTFGWGYLEGYFGSLGNVMIRGDGPGDGTPDDKYAFLISGGSGSSAGDQPMNVGSLDVKLSGGNWDSGASSAYFQLGYGNVGTCNIVFDDTNYTTLNKNIGYFTGSLTIANLLISINLATPVNDSPPDLNNYPEVALQLSASTSVMFFGSYLFTARDSGTASMDRPPVRLNPSGSGFFWCPSYFTGSGVSPKTLSYNFTGPPTNILL